MDHVADLVFLSTLILFYLSDPYDPMITDPSPDPYILDKRTYTKMGKNVRKVFCPCPPVTGPKSPPKNYPFPLGA